MADEENLISVATINADHTNRHPDVNTVDSLVEKLEDVVINDLNPDIVTVQELGAKSSRQLSDTLNAWDYHTIRKKPAYDHLTISYRNDKWDLDTTFESKQGKYIALKLINKFDNTEGLVVATHQPYKKKTAVAEAERLVAKFVDEARDTYGYDYLILAGDMNKEPPVVQRWLPDLNRVIVNGSPKTTKSGRKDNIVYDDALSEESYWVWKYPQFTHRPVVATFKLDY